MSIDQQQVTEQSGADQARSLNASGVDASALAGSRVRTPQDVLAMQARIGNRSTRALLARQGKPAAAKRPPLPPVVISGRTFDDAAASFAGMLAAHGIPGPVRMILISGVRIHVYDEKGAPIKDGHFRFLHPVDIPAAVYTQKSGERQFSPVLQRPDGSWGLGAPVRLDTPVHLDHDVEDEPRFQTAITGGAQVIVVPTATDPTAVAPAQEEEDLPEFMQFESPKTANLPAWPLDVKPVSPASMIATVESSTTFLAEITKTRGFNLIDDFAGAMEPTNFKWEVLKLDESLQHIAARARPTKFDAVKEGYAQRMRHLEEDRRTLYGDHPERQSAAGRTLRQAGADRLIEARQALAVVGQTALTVIHLFAGDTNEPNLEDYLDFTWPEPGDYFVRCLATPVHGDKSKYRRATSVAGVMVSVYDPKELAENALPTAEQEIKDARDSVEALKARLAAVKDGPDADRDRRELQIDIDYKTAVVAAGGDPTALQTAELARVRAQIGLLHELEASADSPELKRTVQERITHLEASAGEIQRILRGTAERLEAGYDPVGLMSAALVDEDTGQPANLMFAVGERRLVNQPETEVVIQEITEAKRGRLFSGRGDGRTRTADAWEAALGDLRRNLNRGRGLLEWRAPARYAGLRVDVANPMTLQVAGLDQVKETVDDAANVATLAALVAAPLTGGASLSVLAVVGPISAASSLYNVVNKSAYHDLELDESTIMDAINIASLGLGHLSEIKAATKGLQIVATSSRVAVRLFAAGQLVVIAWSTYNQIFGPGPEGEDPRAGRRRRLIALLNLMPAAGIPIAEHLWPPGTRPRLGGKGERESIPGFDPTKMPAVYDDAKPPTRDSRPSGAGDHGEQGPAAPATRRRAIHAELGLPPGLRRSVSVEIDPRLSGRSVEVHYDIDLATGTVRDVRMLVGEHATARDVELHARTAQTMLRYAGLMGRVRLLVLDLAQFLGKNQPAVGTRAWEAKLELEKLPEIIKDRMARLSDPYLTVDARDALIADLGALEGQAAVHSQTVAEFDRQPAAATEPARGFVAAHASQDALGAGTPETTISPGTTREKAFDQLGGDDVSLGFGRWSDIVVRELGLHTRAELIEMLPEPAGATPAKLRSDLRAQVIPEIVASLRDPARLQQTRTYQDRVAAGDSHEQALAAATRSELQRIGASLSEADRDVITKSLHAAETADRSQAATERLQQAREAKERADTEVTAAAERVATAQQALADATAAYENAKVDDQPRRELRKAQTAAKGELERARSQANAAGRRQASAQTELSEATTGAAKRQDIAERSSKAAESARAAQVRAEEPAADDVPRLKPGEPFTADKFRPEFDRKRTPFETVRGQPGEIKPGAHVRIWEGRLPAAMDPRLDSILALADSNPQQAGNDFAKLVGEEMGWTDLAERFRSRHGKIGRRWDFGNTKEITIEGRDKGFSSDKLDQLWFDLNESGSIDLTVPYLSEAAERQLGRLAAEWNAWTGKVPSILVREVRPKTPAATPPPAGGAATPAGAGAPAP